MLSTTDIDRVLHSRARLADFVVTKEMETVAKALELHYRLGAHHDSLEDELLATAIKQMSPLSATTASLAADALKVEIAADALKEATNDVQKAYEDAIMERLSNDAQTEAELFRGAIGAVRVGNTSFRKVYTSVWDMIERAEPDGLKSYVEQAAQAKHFANRIQEMRTYSMMWRDKYIESYRKEQSGLVQPHGGDLVSLYRSAARTKRHFDEAIRLVVQRSGVTDAEFKPPLGLKKSSRVIEKVRRTASQVFLLCNSITLPTLTCAARLHTCCCPAVRVFPSRGRQRCATGTTSGKSTKSATLFAGWSS